MFVGRRVAEHVSLTPADSAGVAFRGPRPQLRSRTAIWGFAFTAAVAFALVNVVDPYSGSAATPAYAGTLQNVTTTSRYGDAPTQSLTAPDGSALAITREAVGAKAKPTPTPTPTPVSAPSTGKTSSGGGGSAAAPPAGTPDPGSAKSIAYQMLQERGMGDEQYSCLVSLWNRESGWNVYAHNSSSGAYGIPQSLPGSKMASAGSDWQTNPATQITWGLGYITGRYGTPCGAWGHSESSGWY